MREVSGAIPENGEFLVSSILQRVIGCPADGIQHIKGIGMNNSVTVAETSKGRYVVRTNVESHLFRYQREAWCYRQLADTRVPTPQVLGCGILNGHSYSVAPFINNSQPIGEDFDQLRVWRILGAYARQLNQIHPLESDVEIATYFPINWERQVTDDVGLIFKDTLWLDRGLITAGQQNSVRRYLLDCAKTDVQKGISQFDLSIANAVICNSDYDKIYLLDLEYATIAPVPYYQLACIAADRGYESKITKAFFTGYGVEDRDVTYNAAELERFILYRLMRAAAWARDRYPSLLDENIERTRPFLAQLVKRRFS